MDHLEHENIGSNNLSAVNNPVSTLSYSPDGKYLIGVLGNRISMWDARSGKKLRTFLAHSNAKMVSIAYDPVDRQIAIGDSNGNINIFNEMGKWIKVLPK